MSNILKLSKRSADLLSEVDQKASESQIGAVSSKTLPKKLEDTPLSTFEPIPHELLSNNDRRITVAGLVSERRTLGGTAQAEHFISELYSASQINRGPAGFSPGSRLHFDMLTGRDGRIDHSDYLNFHNNQV